MHYIKKSTKIDTCYLQAVYDVPKFKIAVKKTAKSIKALYEKKYREEKIRIEAIAFTGTSGAAMAYPLSYLLNIPLICIRKDEERSHYRKDGYGEVEGIKNPANYIIVDDMICSGETIDKITKKIKNMYPKAKCLGIFLYSSYQISPYKKIPVIASHD